METIDGTKTKMSSSHGKPDLVSKLRAVELEIDAVKSAVEQLENYKRDEDHFPDGEVKAELENAEVEPKVLHSSANDSNLQHALAADRLKSLIKTRVQLEKEISESSGNCKHDRLIRDLIKEEPKSKRQLKRVDKKSRNQSKRLKRVSLDENDDFDAVLNAASTGFVETVSDFFIFLSIEQRYTLMCIYKMTIMIYLS